jgi:cyclopropane fatty-acyl-phospholipid synthase-like methyltransferase
MIRPESTEDILELMDGHIVAAALGAAMELGVFWLLAEKPLSTTGLAQSLNIALNRCHLWLRILCRLGLLEEDAGCYVPTNLAREAILNAQSQETWAFQALEDHDRSLFVRDLALNITKPMPDLQTRGTLADYFTRFQQDSNYAAGLTRKLYEIHISLAEQLANMLDLRGVKRLLDLGGGSGVVTFALLRRWDDLTSVVVEVESVCQVGREIALENGLETRVTYMAGDFEHVDLPTGFDMVILCDVDAFSELLFRRIHEALPANGRLVIVDKLTTSRTSAPPSRLLSAFVASMQYPAPSIDFTTVDDVLALLQRTGFRDASATSVPHKDNLPWNVDWIMLEARA